MKTCPVCRSSKGPNYQHHRGVYTATQQGFTPGFCRLKCAAYLAGIRGGWIVIETWDKKWEYRHPDRPRRRGEPLDSKSEIWEMLPLRIQRRIELVPLSLREHFIDRWRFFHRISRKCHLNSMNRNEYRMTAITYLNRARHLDEGLSPPVLVDNPPSVLQTGAPPGSLFGYSAETAHKYYCWLQENWH